jgi:hypothetical protein
VIAPVAIVQVGCSVALAVGASGGVGCELIVTLVPDEIQPDALFAVTLNVPDDTELKMPDVLV